MMFFKSGSRQRARGNSWQVFFKNGELFVSFVFIIWIRFADLAFFQLKFWIVLLIKFLNSAFYQGAFK